MNEYYAGARGRDGLATVFRFASCERAPNRRPTTFPPSHPSIRLPLFALHLTHHPHALPLRLLSIRAGVARGDSPLVLPPSSRAASLTSHPRASLLGLAVQPLILRWELLPLLNWASQTGLGSAATFLLWLNPIPRDPWLAVRLLCSHHILLASSTVPSFGTGLRLLCICLPVSSVVSSACFSFGLLIRCDFLPEH
jgi:hypothetical protein